MEGRTDDVINIKGMWFTSGEIESSILSLDSIIECSSVENKNKLGISTLLLFIVSPEINNSIGLEGSQMGVFNQESGSNMSTSTDSQENIKEISLLNGGYFNGEYRTESQQSTEIEIDIEIF